jgi:DNA-binding MarR family transcriptional regulator
MATEDLIVKAINILSDEMRLCMRKYKEQTADGKALFNLSITQLHYLHVIKERTAPTITELAEIFAVQKSTVTVAVNKLLQRGFLEKTASQSDLRVVHVSLSKQGKRLIEIEDQGYYQFAGQVIQSLTEAEKVEFVKLLQKITQ